MSFESICAGRRGLWAGLALSAMATASLAQLVSPPGEEAPAPAVTPAPARPVQSAPAPRANPAAPSVPLAVPGKKAMLVFEQKHHDFGKVVDVDEQTAVFKFTNTGDQVVKILDKKATCGCTVPDLAKTEYQPGESGEIAVTYNGRGKHGRQNQTVTLTTDDPGEPRVQLTISVEVMPLVSIEPAIVQFGQVNKGEPKTARVTVTGRSPDFKVIDATLSDPGKMKIEVVSTEPAMVDGKPGAKVTLELSVPADHPVGRISQTGTLRTTEPRRDIMNFTALGEVLGDLAANPGRIALGNIKPGSDFRGELKLLSRSGKAFKVISAKADAPVDQPLDVKIIPDPATGATEYTLELSGVAPAKTMLLRGELLVETDVPDEKNVRLPFWGTVRAVN